MRRFFRATRGRSRKWSRSWRGRILRRFGSMFAEAAKVLGSRTDALVPRPLRGCCRSVNRRDGGRRRRNKQFFGCGTRQCRALRDRQECLSYPIPRQCDAVTAIRSCGVCIVRAIDQRRGGSRCSLDDQRYALARAAGRRGRRRGAAHRRRHLQRRFTARWPRTGRSPSKWARYCATRLASGQGWRFGSAEQQRVASLLAGRARQLVPSVARRVIGEWTSSVLGTARTKAARQAAAASRVDIAAPGGSLDSMPLRRDVAARSGLRVDERR